LRPAKTFVIFIAACLLQFGVSAQSDPFQTERDQLTADSIFWSKVMSIPDIQQIDTSGIYLETIQEGTGASPTADNEVLLYFSIEDNRGILLLSNLHDEKPSQIYLGVTSIGWRKGFSVLQKGVNTVSLFRKKLNHHLQEQEEYACT
jgi:hypothetical protein